MSRQSELDLLLACENVTESETTAVDIESTPSVTDQARESATQDGADAAIEPPGLDAASAFGASAPESWSQNNILASTSFTGFAPNRYDLSSAQTIALLNLARRIVGHQGDPQPVRCIRIVGYAAAKAGHLAKRRVAIVHAALQQAIDAMWPRLTREISFIEEMIPLEKPQSRDAGQPGEQARGIKVILESGGLKGAKTFPAIVSTASDQFAWQTVPAGPPATRAESPETPAGRALRAPSAHGFFYVLSTGVAPNRWIASLEINFEPSDRRHSPRENPIAVRATGLLISPRHILTCGHCVYSRCHESPRQDAAKNTQSIFVGLLAATSSTITPAGNATAQPFQSMSADHPDALRCSARWRVSLGVNTEFDFGLITLPDAVPRTVRFWGGHNYQITPLPDEKLRGATVQTAGYPEFQPNKAEILSGSPSGPAHQPTQWTTLGIITGIEGQQVFHDMPIHPGQDGSPVWVQTDGRRVLVGILGLNQQITRITPLLLKRLRAWMTQDGVRPSF